MHVALFRREHLQSADPALIGSATADQFQRTHGALQAWSEAQHKDDGAHAAITADSIDVTGNMAGAYLRLRGPSVDGALLHAENEQLDENGLVRASVISVRGQTATYVAKSTDPSLSAALILTSANGDQGGLVQADGQTFLPVGATAPHLLVSKGIAEHNRSVAMGDWADEAFDAANFTSDVGSWTVASGDVVTNRYMRIGSTLFWNLELATTTVAGTPAALRATLPAGLTLAARSVGQFFRASDNGAVGIGLMVIVAGQTFVDFRSSVAGGGWANAVNGTGIQAWIQLEVQ